MNRHEHHRISDEELNAYIDDELEFDERKRIFHTLEEDEQLTHDAQELRQLRAMLRNAYRNPPSPQSAKQRKRTVYDFLSKGVAAALLITIGIAGGWVGNQEFTGPTRHALDQPMSMVENEQDNLLLHISSNNPAKMEAALNYAEQLLADKSRQGKPFRLEVVTNNGGIELLRRDTSPFPDRIESLLSRYDNISFLACANALRKLRARGIDVELLPGTRSDHTAIDEIVDRLEGGWRYLKV